LLVGLGCFSRERGRGRPCHTSFVCIGRWVRWERLRGVVAVACARRATGAPFRILAIARRATGAPFRLRASRACGANFLAFRERIEVRGAALVALTLALSRRERGCRLRGIGICVGASKAPFSPGV
jgi:hypothetical protein